MYRIYHRESNPKTKWQIVAAFITRYDATNWVHSRLPTYSLDYKIMRGTKVVDKYIQKVA